MKRLTVAVISLVLSGCAAMSEQECLYADWNAIGYEDGAAGRPVSAVSPRRTACAKKAGITVDMLAYNAGRNEGLRSYCQASNGYAVGSGGYTYHGVCKGPAEDNFMLAYESGRRLYVLEHAVSSAEYQIRQAHTDLNNIEHHIIDAEGSMIAPDTPPTKRLSLLSEIKKLYEEKGRIETAIIALNRDQVRAEEELANYREFQAYNGPYPTAVTEPTAVDY